MSLLQGAYWRPENIEHCILHFFCKQRILILNALILAILRTFIKEDLAERGLL